MRTLTLTLGLIFSFQSLTAGFINLNGVLNDISPNESKVLYTCKTEINQPYSDGYLYLFDRQSNKSVKVAYDKALDYSRKSFFLSDDSILIIMDYEVSILDLKNNSKRTIFTCLDKNSFIISSLIGTDSQIFLTLGNFNDSKISLMVFDNRSLTIKTLHSTKVEIIPTDNFFNYYALGYKMFFLDNSKFYNTENSKLVSTYRHIAFNNELGNHIIASNSKSICFLEEKPNSYQLGFISTGTLDHQFINIPITKPDQTWIETMIHNSRFVLSVGDDYFDIGPTGEYRKIKSRTLYSGKSLIINKTENYKIELISVSQ